MRFLKRLVYQKDRRRHVRHTSTSLTVTVDGHKYKTVDWSLGGFRLAGFHRPVAAKDRIAGLLAPPKGAKGDFVAEIVWTADDGHLGVRFLEITPRTFLAMADLKEC